MIYLRKKPTIQPVLIPRNGIELSQVAALTLENNVSNEIWRVSVSSSEGNIFLAGDYFRVFLTLPDLVPGEYTYKLETPDGFAILVGVASVLSDTPEAIEFDEDEDFIQYNEDLD